MATGGPVLTTFREAAVEWAAGDAASRSWIRPQRHLQRDSTRRHFVSSPALHTADEEATELAPTVFDELGLHVHERRSSEAIVEGAKQLSSRLLADGGSPRALAGWTYRMYVAADYPAELAAWAGLAEWYNMLENGVISGSAEDVDAATIDAARLLVEGRPAPPVRLDRLFLDRPTRRSRVARLLQRRRR